MAISIDRLSGGNTPADGSDPRTFPAIWNATAALLEANVGAGGASVTVSETAPTDPADGDLWWDSGDGEMYLWYDADSVWVSAAGPSVAVQSTAPTGYEGQLWLDDTDGSMYVYYTDPGGGSSQWIGAVSRSGGILQVVSTTKTDVFSTSSTSLTDITSLSASITPRSASSKIYVVLNIGVLDADGLKGISGDVTRNGTPIGAPGGEGWFQTIVAADRPEVVSWTYLDSPSTASTVVYQARVATTSGTAYLNRNQLNTRSGVSTITLIEVAG